MVILSTSKLAYKLAHILAHILALNISFEFNNFN